MTTNLKKQLPSIGTGRVLKGGMFCVIVNNCSSGKKSVKCASKPNLEHFSMRQFT